MAALSDYLENRLIDHIFRAQPYSAPATLYFGLLTTADNDANSSLVEVSGGSYARAAVTPSLANFSGTQSAGSTAASSGTSGQISNNVTIAFPEPTADWGLIAAFAVFDASSGGNLLFYGSLATPKNVNNGDSAPSFAPGALTFSLD